jgi:hypothetical protein
VTTPVSWGCDVLLHVVFREYLLQVLDTSSIAYFIMQVKIPHYNDVIMYQGHVTDV